MTGLLIIFASELSLTGLLPSNHSEVLDFILKTDVEKGTAGD